MVNLLSIKEEESKRYRSNFVPKYLQCVGIIVMNTQSLREDVKTKQGEKRQRKKSERHTAMTSRKFDCGRAFAPNSWSDGGGEKM